MLASHRIRALALSLPAAIGLCPLAGAAPPAEVAGLAWCAGSSACLTWEADPAAATYTVYRGDGAQLPGLADGVEDSSYAGIFEANSTGEMLIGAPPAGSLYWYLATASNADGEGPAGHLRQLDPAGTSCGDRAYLEDFAGLPDGAPWPAPWVPAGSVDVADVQGEAARSRPTVSFYSLARLRAPLLPIGESDVEVRFTFVFEDTATQGVGFYVRSNGGYLNQTFPAGQGYAVFVEGFRQQPGIGLWKETAGTEEPLLIDFDDALGFQDGVRYRVRFRVNQNGPTETLLQARVWPEGTPEPVAWQVQISDATAGVLQGVRGDLALDSWSSITPNTPGSPTPQHTLVDDVEVVRLCNPLGGMAPVEAVGEALAFDAGPARLAGDAQADGPDRVALSPDEDALYAVDSEAGSITRWQVAGDGSLTAPTTFASGLTLPEGVTVDRQGNLYVATWDFRIEVFAPDGTPWGTIHLPHRATSCTFDDAERRTLWITAPEGLFRVRLAPPGL